MFWRFGAAAVPTIDSLLDKEGTTVEDLLQEDDILQETKGQNKRLLDLYRILCSTVYFYIQFLSSLCRPSHLRELFQLILHPEKVDELSRFKLTVVALEVICCDAKPLTRQIINSPALLNDFYRTLLVENKPPLSSLHATAVMKVTNLLLTSEPDKMISYLQDRGDFVAQVLVHLESPSMVELLLKLMTMDDDRLSDDQVITQWLVEERLVEQLIEQLDPSKSDEMHACASQAMMDMITAVHQSQNPEPDWLNIHLLIKRMTSSENVKKLVGYVLDRQGSHAISSLINGVGVLIELLRRGTCSEEYEDHGPPPSEFGEAAALQASLPQKPIHHRNPLQIDQVVSVLSADLDRISTALKTPMVHLPERATSIGTIEPFGQERLNLIELIAELVRTLDEAVLDAMLSDGLLDVVVDMLFRYPWNNLVHMVVCDIVHTITEAELDKSAKLVGCMVVRCRLLTRICDAVRANAEVCSRPKGLRLGYMGHITLITDRLVQFYVRHCAQLDDDTRQAFEDETWCHYVEHAFLETKRREGRVLGGIKPQTLNGINATGLVNELLMAGENGTLDNGGNANGPPGAAPFIHTVTSETDQLARHMIQQVLSGFPMSMDAREAAIRSALFEDAQSLMTKEDSKRDDWLELERNGTGANSAMDPTLTETESINPSGAIESEDSVSEASDSSLEFRDGILDGDSTNDEDEKEQRGKETTVTSLGAESTNTVSTQDSTTTVGTDASTATASTGGTSLMSESSGAISLLSGSSGLTSPIPLTITSPPLLATTTPVTNAPAISNPKPSVPIQLAPKPTLSKPILSPPLLHHPPPPSSPSRTPAPPAIASPAGSGSATPVLGSPTPPLPAPPVLPPNLAKSPPPKPGSLPPPPRVPSITPPSLSASSSAQSLRSSGSAINYNSAGTHQQQTSPATLLSPPPFGKGRLRSVSQPPESAFLAQLPPPPHPPTITKPVSPSPNEVTKKVEQMDPFGRRPSATSDPFKANGDDPFGAKSDDPFSATLSPNSTTETSASSSETSRDDGIQWQ